MEEIRSYELQKFINIVFEAVQKSSIGPIYLTEDNGSIKLGIDGHPILKSLPYNTYIALINGMCPKSSINITGSVTDSDKK